jgi:predicted TPR repeat methyltransferase
MKGLVFTELIEFVEDNLGFDVADKMIEKADTKEGGAYTQAGNYPFEELQSLVVALSEVTEQPIGALLNVFGKHMFNQILHIYPSAVEGHTVLTFLASVDEKVHVEVKKLYPDASLPRFFVEDLNDNRLIMSYRSEKQLDDFAAGMIEGAAEHFSDPVTIEKTIINEEPYTVKFEITKQ